MATADEITAFDRVELSERVDDAPAGARGGVLEVRDSDVAMVEITDPPLDAVDRILFVPVAQLRPLRVDPPGET
jgi:hypothetical protein